MPIKKEEGYKKYLVYIKDAVYIIGLSIALYGWISTKSESQAILKITVQNNTETLKNVEEFMEKQATLNGSFIQFMKMKDHN